MYGEERRSSTPVRQGEEINVKIEAVGEKGDGIAKVKGFVIFVPNTKQGDEVKVKVSKVLKKVAFAEVVGESSGVEESPESDEESSDEDTMDNQEEEISEE